MRISVLQLNLNGDHYWDTLVEHIEKNDYDILQFQEVTGKHTLFGNLNSKRDVFLEIEKKFRNTYEGELMLTDRVSSHKNAYFGNAIFYKKSFTLVSKRLVFIHKNTLPFPRDAKSFENLGRGLLHLTLKKDGVSFSTMTLHGAWAKTPNEEVHQTKQAEILFNYLHSVKPPYILTGDFNLSPDQPTMVRLSNFLHNGGEIGAVTNTLNLRTHRARNQFPDGIVVDYIFSTKDMEIINCTVLSKEDLSDHLALKAIIEVT